MQRSNKLVSNVEKFGSRSSIHGVSFTLDRALPWPDRLFWRLLFLGSVSLAAYMITTTVQDWQDRQVVTTLKTMSKPVTGKNNKVTNPRPFGQVCINLCISFLRPQISYDHNMRLRTVGRGDGGCSLQQVPRLD